MVKFYSQTIVLLFLTGIGFCQVNENMVDLGFDRKDTLQNTQPLILDQIREYILFREADLQEIIIGGQVSSIFHEMVDDAIIYINIEKQHLDSVRTNNGLFYLPIPFSDREQLIDITILHPDFHPFDTSFVNTLNKPVVLNLIIVPKHKILLRGRVFAGNVPIEGADVEIISANETYHLQTLGCYYDEEGYWNCLFDGMFKKELTANDPSDSIKMIFTSKGMKPLHTGMIVNEYKGEVMQIKMKYTSKLPEMPSNNLNLKLAFPFITSDHDWFVDISYYRALNKTNLKRIAWGVDGNMYISTISVSYPTLPGLEPAVSDSSYITGFAGPSVLFWILSPDRRRFSTYAGCTFSIQLNDPQFVLQPFLGTRYFLDINKALSFEFRYAEYDRDVTHYVFNPYGNASSYSVSEHFVKFHFNLGIQIVF